MTKQVAVVLAGCGVFDGSEIYETTLTLLRLDQLGIGYRCFAPDWPVVILARLPSLILMSSMQ